MGRVKDLLLEGEEIFYSSLEDGMTNDQALSVVEQKLGTMVRDGVEAQHELECSIGYMEREDE